MADKTDIKIRDARDRVIDLLGFGETYPLQDLRILDDQLTVPFGTSAKIPIESSQLEVVYQLYDGDDVPVRPSPRRPPITAQGVGGLLILESPKISDDVSYQIRALKNDSGRKAYLHEIATIKVGLDVRLSALILNTPFLEPERDNAKENDARIVDYGSAVTIQLKKSQEGVDYRLVSLQGTQEILLSEPDVRGTLDDIRLSAKALYEDTDIRIRATKTFDISEGRETQTALLDIVLPLKIRANTALQVTIDPEPIIDFKANTRVKIKASQKSARYRLFRRKISDADFVFGESSALTRVSVLRSDGGKVQVSVPAKQSIWQVPEGFIALGTQKVGTGGALSFSVASLSEDTMIIVQAEKLHQAQAARSSAMKLSQAAVVLLRPDGNPTLHLRVKLKASNAVSAVEVLGGEPGVFYHLRKDLTGPDLSLPAYFYKKDENNPEQNKGLNQLRIGIDFVVPRRAPQKIDEPDRSRIKPESAVLELNNITLPSVLNVLAVKAQTQIPMGLTQTAMLPKLPQIAFDSARVDRGKTARLVIKASQVGEKYQLFLGGVAVKKAKNGNGEDLVFITNPLTEDTVFELLITQESRTTLEVTRILPLKVDVNVISS